MRRSNRASFRFYLNDRKSTETEPSRAAIRRSAKRREGPLALRSKTWRPLQSLGLFLAVGPRRTRLFSQIAATMVGASFVLGAQAVAMLPDRMRASVLSIFAPLASSAGALQGLVWTPVRAAAGDPSGMLARTTFGVSVFTLACILFGERFAPADRRWSPLERALPPTASLSTGAQAEEKDYPRTATGASQ